MPSIRSILLASWHSLSVNLLNANLGSAPCCYNNISLKLPIRIQTVSSGGTKIRASPTAVNRVEKRNCMTWLAGTCPAPLLLQLNPSTIRFTVRETIPGNIGAFLTLCWDESSSRRRSSGERARTYITVTDGIQSGLRRFYSGTNGTVNNKGALVIHQLVQQLPSSCQLNHRGWRFYADLMICGMMMSSLERIKI